VFNDEANDFTWKPKNYGQKFYGPTLLRQALTHSRNVVTIKLLKKIGIDYTIDYAKKLGIKSELAHNLSIALGSSGVSLLELVNAYSVFDNHGYLVEPAFITKIEDRSGNVLEEMSPSRERVIDKSTAYIMTSMLESVVKEGTGRRVKALNRPVAGKTGTTNNLQDAWFIGYTPRYITGVWVGNDDGASLGKGETGSRAASPIWLGFMSDILKDKPVRIFQVPEGVVFAKIDANTGLLPIPESRKTIFECFKEGTVPTEYTKKPDTIQDAASFFKSDM
jgi:penicillin-binding protein 1A